MVDFSQEVIQDQLIKDLSDTDIVSDLLEDVKLDRTLDEVVEFVARKEQAKSVQSTVRVDPEVSAERQSHITPQTRQPCMHCKGASHGADKMKVKRDTCPALGHTCERCKVKGHYSQACFKSQDCNSWGHKSKQSKWCQKSAKPGEKKDAVENAALNTLCSIFVGNNWDKQEGQDNPSAPPHIWE